MTKYLVILAWPSLNIVASESTGSISALPYDEKIGNVAVLQAFNEEEAKQKVLTMWGFNKDVEKYLRVFDLKDIIDSWSYFQRGK